MISFWISAGILLLIALAFVLLPLRRTPANAATDRQAYNQTIFQQKKAELEQEYKQGIYSQDEFDDALLELQRTFLDDVKGEENQSVSKKQSARGLLLVMLLLMPVAAIWSYAQFNSGYQMLGSPQNTAMTQPQSIEQAIYSLIEHLRAQPQDIDGWKLLARTYFAQQDFAKAAQVYEKLNQLTQSSDPEVMVGLVEASSYQTGNQFTEQQMALLKKALSINPNHERALWYAGYAAYLQQNYQQAVNYWQHLLSQVPPAETEVKAALNKFLLDAKNKAGMPVADEAAQQEDVSAASASAPRQIEVTVTIEPQLLSKVTAADTLFIYARAAAGPRMPLALIRSQPGGWPVTVVLNEQQNMIEGMSLNTFDSVQVVARISRSGQATPQAGDLYGESEEIDLTTYKPTISVNIKHLIQ